MGNFKSKRRTLTEKRDQNITAETYKVAYESNRESYLTDEQADLDRKASLIDISKYEYPFENLVFEGGGTKGLCYCGVVETLEEVGLMKNIRRVAGTSAGAITASFVAVGYNSKQLKEIMDIDLCPFAFDHKWGYLSLIPSLMKKYGWNPAHKLSQWLGDTLNNKTKEKGVTDITFDQLYKLYGVELCITVTNVNMMATEFFHPKTTPNVKVKEAVRMSMSIPGLFIPTRMRLSGQEDIYIDGGVLCNYPISCFDGWWLSMEKGDCFFERMHPLHMLPTLFEKRERFGTYNEKTLGLLLFSDGEDDIFRDKFDRRKGLELADFPKTKLGIAAKKKRAARMKKEKMLKANAKENTMAVQTFLNVLRKHNTNDDDEIDLEELRAALEDEDFKDFKDDLFGKNITAEEAMAKIDIDNDHKIQYYELDRFLGSVGQSLQSQFLGQRRKEINSFPDFLSAVEETLMKNAQRLYVEDRDFERTVGINSGYVETTDFAIVNMDREYMYERGRKSTEVFLKYYAAQNNLPRKCDQEHVSTYL